MKKLFTLAAAVLASACLFAADYTIYQATSEGVNTANVNETGISVTFNSMKDVTNNAVISAANETYGIAAGLKAPRWGGNGSGKNITIVVSEKYTATITAYVQSNTANRKISIKTTDVAPADGDLVYVNCAATETVYEVKATELAAGTYYIKADGDKIGLIKLVATVAPTCIDPEFTVSPTEGTGFVGDAIDIAVTSKNDSKPINSAVTVDGVPGVYGTDYTFSVSTGLVQATPLKAGTFEITFSQASDGTYCDAEEIATFVISEKTPVTSFTVEGPTSARVGDEITLTATNFDAAATEIVWRDELNQDLEFGATHTFTPDAEGTYQFFVSASNEFNDKAVVVNHNVSVSIGHNAYLSDLKVNGVTVDGFDSEIFEYKIGEIGVYEALNVVATPADAPYATAVVNVAASGVLVSVIAQDKTTIKEYIIHFTRAKATELVAVSDSLTWDWAKAGSKTDALDGTTLPTNSEEFNFADVLSGQDASFKAESLVGRGQYANGGGYAQVNKLKFHADKNGSIIVEFSNTGSSDRPDRVLLVNDVQTTYKSKTSASHETTDKISVEAGDVVIEALEMKETPAKNMIRVYSLTYVPNSGETAIDNIEAGQVVKAIENGQLVIIKNGVKYNAQGAIVK